MTLAGSLVRAFGDVEKMAELYADDVVWELPSSLGEAAGPHRGKDAVVAFNHQVWGEFYSPIGVEVEVHDELEQRDLSAVRFTYRATEASTRERYENEYSVHVRVRDGKIVEIREFLDTLKLVRYPGLRQYLPPESTL
jgi:ketosteroid isomerase-like protein